MDYFHNNHFCNHFCQIKKEKRIEEEKNINVLVLAANVDAKGPGPIINSLVSKEYMNQLQLIQK